VSGLEQVVVLAADDGAHGPLLRVADDRLPPGEGYGAHDHRAVDVVAVVLAGTLSHRGGGRDVPLRAGDVGVLRAGTGLVHDEVAGEGGARVLQAYLRSAAPYAPAAHAVVAQPRGWVDLERPDTLLWVARPAPGTAVDVPAGLRLVAGPEGVRAALRPAGQVTAADAGTTVVVWQLDTSRPSWAG
jgi:quercetin 2,3-dioxygenase